MLMLLMNSLSPKMYFENQITCIHSTTRVVAKSDEYTRIPAPTCDDSVCDFGAVYKMS